MEVEQWGEKNSVTDGTRKLGNLCRHNDSGGKQTEQKEKRLKTGPDQLHDEKWDVLKGEWSRN